MTVLPMTIAAQQCLSNVLRPMMCCTRLERLVWHAFSDVAALSACVSLVL
jgi:hypothetical protein